MTFEMGNAAFFFGQLGCQLFLLEVECLGIVYGCKGNVPSYTIPNNLVTIFTISF